MISRPKIFFLALISLLMFAGIIGCKEKKSDSPLFKLLPATQTGITFKNQLFENDTLNILNQANIYNGGGVGIGDFNRDGLMDIYFAGNMVSNKLYLNKGKFHFADITAASGTDGAGR